MPPPAPPLPSPPEVRLFRAPAPAAPAEDGHSARSRHDGPGIPADELVALPGSAADPAGASVAAAAAAGVLVVRRRGAVVAAAAGVAGSSPVPVAVEVTIESGAVIGVGHEARRARDTLALHAAGPGGRGAVGGAENPVVRGGDAGLADQLLLDSAPEAPAAHAGGAVEGEAGAHVHGEDAARAPVPRLAGEGRAQGGRHVLGHPHELGAAPALGRAGRGHGVGVERAAAGACPADRHGAARDGAGGHDVLVCARIVQVRVARGVASGDAVPVRTAVGAVDLGVLHLDEDQQVARGDGRGGAGGRSHGDRSPSRAHRRRDRVVGVDDPGEGAARAVLAGRGADAGGFRPRWRSSAEPLNESSWTSPVFDRNRTVIGQADEGEGETISAAFSPMPRGPKSSHFSDPGSFSGPLRSRAPGISRGRPWRRRGDFPSPPSRSR